MSRPTSRRRASAAARAAALALAGCGLAGSSETGNVSVSVTRDFGSAPVGSSMQRRVPGSETVMGLLERSFRVSTRHRDSFVESIDGHSSGQGRLDWAYYVNGILAPKGAARTAVHAGDRVWWDLHDSTAADQIPAVVGSYPEPFTTGVGGRKLPTVLDCASDVESACNKVGSALRKAGVKISYQLLGGGSGSDSLAVVVGTWKDLRGVIAADLIAAGPAQSGVYAQFVGNAGQALELDNPKGSIVRTLRTGAGLIAATEQPSLNQPTWLITGTDVAGVDAAAAALTSARLHDHFALVVDGSQDLPVPLSPRQ